MSLFSGMNGNRWFGRVSWEFQNIRHHHGHTRNDGDSIEVNKHGKVRRAKLYYLRKLTGKKARIAEKKTIAKSAE
jgi:hypothetical protein